MAPLLAILATVALPSVARLRSNSPRSRFNRHRNNSSGQRNGAKLPKMVLERQYAGPLEDTVIQRLRDPVDGTICYLYLPISAPHSPTTATGFVQYGPNTIGTINCVPGTPAHGPHLQDASNKRHHNLSKLPLPASLHAYLLLC